MIFFGVFRSSLASSTRMVHLFNKSMYSPSLAVCTNGTITSNNLKIFILSISVSLGGIAGATVGLAGADAEAEIGLAGADAEAGAETDAEAAIGLAGADAAEIPGPGTVCRARRWDK